MEEPAVGTRGGTPKPCLFYLIKVKFKREGTLVSDRGALFGTPTKGLSIRVGRKKKLPYLKVFEKKNEGYAGPLNSRRLRDY